MSAALWTSDVYGHSLDLYIAVTFFAAFLHLLCIYAIWNHGDSILHGGGQWQSSEVECAQMKPAVTTARDTTTGTTTAAAADEEISSEYATVGVVLPLLRRVVFRWRVR